MKRRNKIILVTEQKISLETHKLIRAIDCNIKKKQKKKPYNLNKSNKKKHYTIKFKRKTITGSSNEKAKEK